MPGCAALGCNNRSEKGYMMKCFPRDPVLRQIWKERVGRGGWEPSNNSFLCHMHFESNQWIVTPSGRVKLKKGALPSIFLVTSTRKSSKKRGISESDTNVDNCDDFVIEYLDDDLLSSPHGQNIHFNKEKSSKGQVLRTFNNENIFISADENNVDVENLLSDGNYIVLNESNKGDGKTTNNNRNFIKVEVKIEGEDRLSSDEYMKIEKRLKLVCDGKKYDDLINKRESSIEESDNTGVNECNKNSGQDSRVLLLMEDKEDDKIGLTKEQNSTLEIKDALCSFIDTNAVHLNNNILGHNKRNDNNDTDRIFEVEEQSKFTIKISGVPEDIYEITQNLDPLLDGCTKQKLSDTDCNSSEAFVTSKIIVNCSNIKDRSIVDNFSSDDDGVCTNLRDNLISSCNNTSAMKELVKKYRDLVAKYELQQQLIDTLSQSMKHKDIGETTANLFDAELKKKTIEIVDLKGKLKKKCPLSKKFTKEKVDLQLEADESSMYNKFKSRINQLEVTNKQLMKSLSMEVQNKRKLEYQVKDRENKIKELNWKLEKAAKFYERSAKNTNTYRRKLLNLQTILRRKSMLEDKKLTFEELSSEHSQKSFSKKSLSIAMSILKSCGQRGYSKLIGYNFPLPAIMVLRQTFPHESVLQGMRLNEGGNRNLEASRGMMKSDKIDYFELASGTVQDIFNENDDDYVLDINELRRYNILNDNKPR